MNYKICIPSFNRETIVKQQTLNTLRHNNIPLNCIYVFVVEEQYNAYQKSLNENNSDNVEFNIIVGKHGLVNQRQFIQDYFPVGEWIIMLDDDIKEICLELTDYKSLHEFFTDAFFKCVQHNTCIWGAYPVFNPYFRKTKKPMTKHLNYIIGAFYGIINTPFRDELNIKNYSLLDEKEDVFRTLLYWQYMNCILRFNRVGFKTVYYNSVGGMGTKTARIRSSAEACCILEKHFNIFGKTKIRKSGNSKGIFEFVLKRNVF